MMTLTEKGLLRTEETFEEIAALHGMPTEVRVWYWEFERIERDCIDNEGEYEQRHVEVLIPDGLKWLSYDWPIGVMKPEFERHIWVKLSHRFSGPVTGCPVPTTPDKVIAQYWSNWIMYELCTCSDVPPKNDIYEQDLKISVTRVGGTPVSIKEESMSS